MFRGGLNFCLSVCEVLLNVLPRPLRIAVVGSGISGLSAAWLLAARHDVTLYEASPRLGGHSNTVLVDHGSQRTAVDTGFIVYNERTYPNLIAFLHYLDVPTHETTMSFAVSANGGALEYSGTGFSGIFGQKTNLVRPRFWMMLRDLVRFYRNAARDMSRDLGDQTLGQYLDSGRYSHAFREDHLYPMAAAIWSTPAGRVSDYPAAAFIRFCDNHGLLNLGARPAWRTINGGSCMYVNKIAALLGDKVRLSTPVQQIRRGENCVTVIDALGGEDVYDHVVLASHADQSLRMLGDCDDRERAVLGAFQYTKNRTILHSDPALMPRRRAVWSAWNYLARSGAGANEAPAVSYWMNQLQSLPGAPDMFVTLNPAFEPRADLVHRVETYEHPLFDQGAIAAQPQVWSLQGVRNTWFCGAWMGAGFHEDGLQSGLAVAEALGGVRRPWNVANESGRIFVGPPPELASAAEFA
jgi:predicted NAD/FAD-binding protein